MKKLFALTLMTLLMLSLFGCADNALSPAVESNQSLEIQTEAQAQAQTEEPTVAETVAETVAPVKDKAPSKAENKDEKIGEDKAKEIALEHAGLKESDVSHIFVELDFDDGILRYEVDFHQGQYEYDYDIDAKTGKILSYDKDIDD